MPTILYQNDWYKVYQKKDTYVMVNEATGVEEYENKLLVVVIKTAKEANDYLLQIKMEKENEPVSKQA